MWPSTSRKKPARTRTVSDCAVFLDEMASRDLAAHVDELDRRDVHTDRLALLENQRRIGELVAARIEWA